MPRNLRRCSRPDVDDRLLRANPVAIPMSRTAASLITIVLLASVALPGPALAQAPQTLCEPLLAPVVAPQGITAVAVTVDAELTCEGDACAVRTTQTYHLRNEAPDRPASIRVGLPAVAGGCVAPGPAALTPGGGASIVPAAPDEAYTAAWEVELPAGATERLILTAAAPVPTRHVTRWLWDGARLTGWGTVEGVRVELRLPALYGHDALLDAQPHRSTFDGYRLAWSYEAVADVPLHAVTLLTPPAAERLGALRAQGAHAELGRLYLEIRGEASEGGWATPDLSAGALAELAMAADADPDDARLARDLAALYLGRESPTPEGRLNDLLLAARELERLRALEPGDEGLRRDLCLTYYRVATAASVAGDPAAALAYLRRAEELGGVDLVPEFGGSEELFLRWALGLARQGQVMEAFAQVADRLRPETRDALLRHAPPLSALRIESVLSPDELALVYHLQPYGPVVEATAARLEELAVLLNAVGPASASVEGDERALRVHLRLPYGSTGELDAARVELAEALGREEDLLAAVLAAPLQGSGADYRLDRLALRERAAHRWEVNLGPLAEQWEAEAEYAGWRIVELDSYRPEVERDRLEQQLALLALREQAAVWEYVPLGAHVVHRLAPALPDGRELAEAPAWTVGWGESRVLEWERSLWNWPRVGALGGAAGLLVLGAAYAAVRPRRG